MMRAPQGMAMRVDMRIDKRPDICQPYGTELVVEDNKSTTKHGGEGERPSVC